MIRKFVPVALPLALAACQMPQAITLPDATGVSGAANPYESIRNANPASVVGEYTHRPPVDPRPWRELNRDQTPDSGAGS